MAIQGGCDCGAARYVLARETLPAIVCCHCLDCQTRSGSAFDQTGFVDPAEMTVTGPVAAFERRMSSGMATTEFSCSKCHTVIYNTHETSPGRYLLRGGTLDDSQSIVPAAHIFTKRKQTWLTLPAGIPAFEEFPAQANFAQILGLA